MRLLKLVAMISVSVMGAAAHGQRLDTAPWEDGFPVDGAGVFVDLRTGHESLVITEIGYTFATRGVQARLRIWQRPGTYVGFDGSSDGWTVVDQIDVESNSEPTPTPVVLNYPITLTAFNRQGFFLEGEMDGLLFTGAPGLPPPQVEWENRDLYLFSDRAREAPFSGRIAAPTCFSGYIEYEPGPELHIRGECPGPIEIDIDEATPGATMIVAYAYGEALNQIPPGRVCAGVTFGLDHTARVLISGRINMLGHRTFRVYAPKAACGKVFIQAIEVERCALTNIREL